jgi:hypothetical protein
VDVTSLAAVASAMQSRQVGDAVAVSVLRKALDAQAAGAVALLQALPQPAPALPANLGNHLNVTA